MLLPTHVDEAKSAGLSVTIAPSLSVRDASINLNRPPFDNPKVVEAFRYAFDRDELVKVFTKGVATAVHQPFPKGYFAFNPEIETLWHYDPTRARALLAQAGYGPGQLSIVITANSLAGADTVVELEQAQLARVPASEGDQAYAQRRFNDEVHRLYGVLNNQLYDRRYLTGGDYTIADIAAYPWLVSWQQQGIDLDEFAYVKRWFEELSARPAVQRGLAVTAGPAEDPADLSQEEQARRRAILYNQRARPVRQ